MSLMVKTMEQIILSSLTDVFTAQRLLNFNQYGFHKGHSTLHLLFEAVNDWLEISHIQLGYNPLIGSLR